MHVIKICADTLRNFSPHARTLGFKKNLLDLGSTKFKNAMAKTAKKTAKKAVKKTAKKVAKKAAKKTAKKAAKKKK